MRSKAPAALVLAILSLNATAQGAGPATANGTCNIAISGSNNTILSARMDGQCGEGISAAQAEKIVRLLNTLFSKKDGAQINAKLDELIEVAGKPSQALNCIGSNCVQNGILNNYDNRQYGAPKPPPEIIDFSQTSAPPEEGVAPGPSGSSGEWGPVAHPGVSMLFRVSAAFARPMFAVRCDHPCVASGFGVRSSPDGGEYTAFSGAIPLYRTSDPDVAVFGLGQVDPLMPNMTVHLTVRSVDSTPITVVAVKGFVQ